MLSHDSTVKGATPVARRRRSASVTTPNAVTGVSSFARSRRTSSLARSKSPVVGTMLYPPSVMVSETILVAGSLMRSRTASGLSGPKRISVMLPITRKSHSPVDDFSTRVYRPDCCCSERARPSSVGRSATPQIAQSVARPCVSSRSMMSA